MSDSAPSPTDPPADMPDPAPRDWSGLERTQDETIAMAGSLGVIVLAVLAGLVGGVPGVLMLFSILTIVMFGVILVISLGS